MRVAVSAGALLTALTGCAYEWRKPEMTEAQLRKDTGECEAYARTNYWRARRAFGAHLKKRKIDNTLIYSYEYPSRSRVESNLFAECMEVKGYRSEEKKPE